MSAMTCFTAVDNVVGLRARGSRSRAIRASLAPACALGVEQSQFQLWSVRARLRARHLHPYLLEKCVRAHDGVVARTHDVQGITLDARRAPQRFAGDADDGRRLKPLFRVFVVGISRSQTCFL